LSLYLGVGWTFLSVIETFYHPLGYTSIDCGYIGLIMTASGCVGGLAASIYIEKKLRSK